MDTQAYLEQFKGLEYLIRAKKEVIENNTAFFGSLAITDTSTIALVNDLQSELGADIQKMVLSQKELCRKIDLLPEKELKAVLALRYVSMKTWEQVAKILDVSIRWVYNLHERALAAFEVVLHLEQDNNRLVTETA